MRPTSSWLSTQETATKGIPVFLINKGTQSTVIQILVLIAVVAHERIECLFLVEINLIGSGGSVPRLTKTFSHWTEWYSRGDTPPVVLEFAD